MKIKSKLTVTGAALACAALAPRSAHAGGIDLYETQLLDAIRAAIGYPPKGIAHSENNH